MFAELAQQRERPWAIGKVQFQENEVLSVLAGTTSRHGKTSSSSSPQGRTPDLRIDGAHWLDLIFIRFPLSLFLMK